MTHYKPLCPDAWAIPPTPIMLKHGNSYHTCSKCGEPVETVNLKDAAMTTPLSIAYSKDLPVSIKRGYYDTIMLRKHWVVSKGEYIYRLTESRCLNGSFTKLLGSGDEDWAERQSKHFGLRIVDGVDL